MKKSRLVVGATCAALVGALALTACSSDGGSGGDDGSKKITFMFRGGPDEKKAYEAAIDKYTEATGVDVEMIVTDADQYATKLQAAVAGNNVPDVFYIEQASLQSYVASGVLLDITDQVEASDVDLDNLWQYGVDSYRFDGTLQGTPEGRLYGLPKDIGPFSFGYNKTMLEAAGIPLPDKDTPLTWEQFVEICKQLTTDTDGDGAVDQWGTGLNVQWNLQSMVWSNGGDFIDADRTKVTVDTPEFADALQKFADLTNVDAVTPSASDAATLDTYQRWMAGEIGFFPVGPWDVSVYNDLDFDYDLIPWPTVGDGGTATWVGSLGIGVSATSKHPDEAVELVTYLSADAQAQQTLVDANIQIPNLIDVATDWAQAADAEPANRQEFLDIAQDYGRAMPAAFTYGAAWYDELWTNIQPVLDGKQTAADYLADVQPRMQALLDESIANAEQAFAGR
ncbi:MAG: sugar ABC transporter substrate-binding protein [Cellulomonas iranensis]|uniref:ABC transporter substrate-binding protein n=1 Tax=Cellulomonas iranensis TaxID=76862 RepID=UPI001B109899|nr:sugar ABC transporter substrate-binding protein [Cellulomonas iranensis]MBO9569509.1 sugar ABC transporter substrate-binding protein [Cellulomonas iranensis]